MKEILIVFIVLLILLLLLSTLGGSLRIKENYDDIPLYEESLLPARARPWEMNPQFVSEETPKKTHVRQEESSQRLPYRKPKSEKMNEPQEVVYPFDGDEAFAAV